MRIIVSCIFAGIALVGCSDPEHIQKAPPASTEYSAPDEQQGFEPPTQVANSAQFTIVGVASAEEPTAELSSVNYQIKIK